ncbi:unnamed protein product, partial [Prorocentrum cordatum]
APEKAAQGASNLGKGTGSVVGSVAAVPSTIGKVATGVTMFPSMLKDPRHGGGAQ